MLPMGIPTWLCYHSICNGTLTLGTSCTELVFYICPELSGTRFHNTELCCIQISCHIHVKDTVSVIACQVITHFVFWKLCV
jgi:hypothetical protein